MSENDNSIEEEIELAWETYSKIESGRMCPECLSEDLLIEGRCTTCLSCGWSKCDL